jgi:hypothetical protein
MMVIVTVSATVMVMMMVMVMHGTCTLESVTLCKCFINSIIA